jgi:hypothetical protein
MMNTRWYSMKTREADFLVMGVGNQFMVLATAGLGCTFIINHVPNYPLGYTIPCTQNILLFSLTNGDMMSKIIANA